MTTGAVDPALVLSNLRSSYLRRRAGALDRSSKYRQRGDAPVSEAFARGQAFAYDQALHLLDSAVAELEDGQEVMKLNGS